MGEEIARCSGPGDALVGRGGVNSKRGSGDGEGERVLAFLCTSRCALCFDDPCTKSTSSPARALSSRSTGKASLSNRCGRRDGDGKRKEDGLLAGVLEFSSRK